MGDSKLIATLSRVVAKAGGPLNYGYVAGRELFVRRRPSRKHGNRSRCSLQQSQGDLTVTRPVSQNRHISFLADPVAPTLMLDNEAICFCCGALALRCKRRN